MSDTKILLVDDHAVVRMGFKMLIEAEPDMTVIAEAESGELGIKAFKELQARYCNYGYYNARDRWY